jgi:hypothetical protein
VGFLFFLGLSSRPEQAGGFPRTVYVRRPAEWRDRGTIFTEKAFRWKHC